MLTKLAELKKSGTVNLRVRARARVR